VLNLETLRRQNSENLQAITVASVVRPKAEAQKLRCPPHHGITWHHAGWVPLWLESNGRGTTGMHIDTSGGLGSELTAPFHWKAPKTTSTTHNPGPGKGRNIRRNLRQAWTLHVPVAPCNAARSTLLFGRVRCQCLPGFPVAGFRLRWHRTNRVWLENVSVWRELVMFQGAQTKKRKSRSGDGCI